MAVAEQLVAIEGVAVGIDELDVVQQPVERLRLADLGANLEVAGTALEGVADTRRLLAGLHGDPLVLGIEVVVGGVDRLGGGDGSQGEIETNGLFRLRAQLLDEGVGVLTGGGQELLDVDAAGSQLAGGSLDAPAQVGVHQRGGRLDVGELDQLGGGAPDQLAA